MTETSPIVSPSTPSQKHQLVLERFASGHTPAQIANEVGLSTKYVRRVLLEMGNPVDQPVPTWTSQIWEMDEDARRLAFARRAQRGARKALGLRDRLRVTVKEEVPLVSLPMAMPAWKRIMAEVAAKHDLSVKDIIGDSRRRPVSAARQEAMYRLKTETSMSYPQIGQRVGNRDHSTVIVGIRAHLCRTGASNAPA